MVGRQSSVVHPMTTLAVLSDIHANLPALEVVLADIEAHDIDYLIVAGDVINWGPFGREVMERLMPLAPAVIRGNNEYYLLDYNTPRAPAAWADQRQWQLLPWLARTMRGRWHTRIATWPDTISLQFPDAPPVGIVHGSPPQQQRGDLSVSVRGTARSDVRRCEGTNDRRRTYTYRDGSACRAATSAQPGVGWMPAARQVRSVVYDPAR